MSDKLFEYKDPQDWYIAQWEKMQTTTNLVKCLRKLHTFRSAGTSLCQDPEGFPLNLSVMRYGSAFSFSDLFDRNLE